MITVQKYVRETVKLIVVALSLMGVIGCTSLKYTATVDTSLQQAVMHITHAQLRKLGLFHKSKPF